jgi:PST family polysaccharide transporter
LLAKISAYLFSNGTKILLVFISAPLALFAAVTVLEGFLAALGLAIAFKKYPCKTKWTLTKSIAGKLLHESWLYILSGVAIIIYMRIDQVMIKKMLGIEQLGIYAAILPIATVWQVIPMALNASLAPYVARKKATNEEDYWLALQKIFKAYAMIGWLVCLPTIALSHWLVPLLYGDLYQEGAYVLSIYVLTNLFINMGMAQGLWMLNERRAIIGLANTLVGAIVCVVGNLLLIPMFGINGVAAAAVLAQMSACVLTNIFSSRRIFFMQIRSITYPFPT